MISKMKNGDIDALSELIDIYSNLVFKVSYDVLQNRELSNECVNETFFKVWLNIKLFNNDEKSFKNWICTIAKYTAIDILRKEKKHDNNLCIDDILVDLVSENSDVDNKIIVKELVDELDEVDKDIFIRKFYKDEKTSVIAKDLGMSENAVYLRISRAKKVLASKLKGV